MKIIYKEFSFSFSEEDIGPVWDRVSVAYEPNTQNNPAERPATNARTPAAGNAKRREMNYVCENRRSGLGAALGLFASRFLRPRSQIGPLGRRISLQARPSKHMHPEPMT